MNKKESRIFPISIKVKDKEFYIEYVNGKLVAGGDLPASKAVKVMLMAYSKGMLTQTEVNMDKSLKNQNV